jgi:magnesium chelatase accessory protein
MWCGPQRLDDEAMKTKPEWNVEGRDWPNRGSSRFVDVAGMKWHVQVLGHGPPLLLVHGTGAATHSWAALAPMLAKRFTVVAPDLPGHGFTELPSGGQYGLPKMARALAALLTELNVEPEIVVGHSAGAAISIQMSLHGAISPKAILSLNGALLPFPGLAAVAFPALAKLLFLNRFAAPFLAWRGSDPNAVDRLIKGTGSTLDARGIDLYGRLFRTERHVAAAVGMMANWDLVALKRGLRKLATPLVLVAADRDRAVPPHAAKDVQAIVPHSKVVRVKNYGHLAHEEAPAEFAKIIRRAVPC